MIYEAKIQTASAVAASIATALGFIAPWPVVVTGLLFALAGGFAGMVVSPPHERMGVTATLFVAAVVGIGAGLAWPHIPLASAMPIQLGMGIAGLCSRWAALKMVAGQLPKFGKGKE